MGDAGSGFLGIMLAGLLLWNTHLSPTLFWSWLIMLGIFIVDATLTLLRRLLQKKKVYEAHRSHAYQHATQHYGAHKPVTLSVLAINLLWLAPLAYLAGTGMVDGFLALIIAYIPLVILAFRWRAGCETGHVSKK
jgi:Fuc2NAc and GlcNAc transferase